MFKIVETNTSNKGYEGILIQRINLKEQFLCFISSVWKGAITNYLTIKKEILAIMLCIKKFKSDYLNQKFLLRIDCKAAKDALTKDVKNVASKQIFASR